MKKVLVETNDDVKIETKDWLKGMKHTVQVVIGMTAHLFICILSKRLPQSTIKDTGENVSNTLFHTGFDT